MHIEPRNGASIDRIYLHTDEGPEAHNGAQAFVLNVLSHEDGGYHAVVDDVNVIQAAPDGYIVWGEGGDNTHALSICFLGYASQTAKDWDSPYARAQLNLAAHWVASRCKAYGIPVAWVRPGAPPTDRGIAEHADDHAAASDGHTDPGVGFPREQFLQLVDEILNPPVDTHLVQLVVDWLNEMKSAVQEGDRSPEVASLNDWLIVNGGPPNLKGDAYGQHTANAVVFFKALWDMPNKDGAVAGHDFAVALVSHALKP